MEGPLVSWLISLVTGGVCGNIAGALFNNVTLGPLGNTVAGVVGGLGGQILALVLGVDELRSISGTVAASGVGGLAVMLLVGYLKNARAKP